MEFPVTPARGSSVMEFPLKTLPVDGRECLLRLEAVHRYAQPMIPEGHVAVVEQETTDSGCVYDEDNASGRYEDR